MKKRYVLMFFLIAVTVGSVDILSGQASVPAGYFSGEIYIHGTDNPIPGSMNVLIRHRARADVYMFSGGEWQLDWRSGFWVEATVNASPEYEYQVDIDDFNSEFPAGVDGAVHVLYSYGDSSETVLFNQAGWCVVGSHIQGSGLNCEDLEWYVMEKIYDQNDNDILDLFEQELIETFCPSLVLNSPDQGVSPEPVNIMAPSHAGDLWARTYNILGEGFEKRVDDDWDPPLSYYYGWLDTGNYSFIDGRAYMYTGAPPGKAYGVYYLIFHFEWAEQGNSSPAWREAYSREAGENLYDDTIYAHLYALGTNYLIQYWFFYPFNDYINNHEGDWEHINVLVNSQDPSDARIVKVDYCFHHNVITVVDPGFDFLVEDGSHPLVFVGGSGSIAFGSGDGSHGSFPINGVWEESGGGCCWVTTRPDETVDGMGRYIPYNEFTVVNVPEPEKIDYFTSPEWSWLKADIPWGHINVDSPGDWLEDFSWLSIFFGDCCFPDDLGDYAPCGPAYNGGWNRTGQIENWYGTYIKGTPNYPVTETNWVPPDSTGGDFNGDGKVDIVDVIGVVGIILHETDPSPYQFWAADMKDDGEINVLDVLAIVNAILGLPSAGYTPLYANCTLELVEKAVGEYELRLTNDVSVSGIQVHLPVHSSDPTIRLTGRSSVLDSASHTGGDDATILLYGASGASIAPGSGPILELSLSGEERPCITEAILAGTPSITATYTGPCWNLIVPLFLREPMLMKHPSICGLQATPGVHAPPNWRSSGWNMSGWREQ